MEYAAFIEFTKETFYAVSENAPESTGRLTPDYLAGYGDGLAAAARAPLPAAPGDQDDIPTQPLFTGGTFQIVLTRTIPPGCAVIVDGNRLMLVTVYTPEPPHE